MQVELLNYTPDPERAVAIAARLCYAPIGATELMEGLSDKEAKKVLETIVKSGHHSALEHASLTFAIDGVSRSLTHQLVRHRIASYNQQSQRYVTSKAINVVTPHTIEGTELQPLFDEAMQNAWAAYDKLLDAGIPAEDARYVLPNAAVTKIVVTMNMRELLHFFSVRCCKRAQWEIREMALQMLELAKQVAPYVFFDAGAPCRRGSCPEGSMSCGEPYQRIVRP
jgi:thymidylate synthase (FAD)